MNVIKCTVHIYDKIQEDLFCCYVFVLLLYARSTSSASCAAYHYLQNYLSESSMHISDRSPWASVCGPLCSPTAASGVVTCRRSRRWRRAGCPGRCGTTSRSDTAWSTPPSAASPPASSTGPGRATYSGTVRNAVERPTLAQ